MRLTKQSSHALAKYVQHHAPRSPEQLRALHALVDRIAAGETTIEDIALLGFRPEYWEQQEFAEPRNIRDDLMEHADALTLLWRLLGERLLGRALASATAVGYAFADDPDILGVVAEAAAIVEMVQFDPDLPPEAMWETWQEYLDTLDAVSETAINAIDPDMIGVEDIARMQRDFGSELVTGVLQQSAARLNEIAAQAIEDGAPREELRRRLQAAFDAEIMPEWRARLIAQTEVIRAANNAARNTYARLGRDEIQWLDGQPGACESCRALHGESIPMDGKSAFEDPVRGFRVHNPPLHPGCRCTIVSLSRDEFLSKTVKYPSLAAAEAQEFARMYVRDAKGRFAVTGGARAPTPTSRAFDEAPLVGNHAAWRKKHQQLYDSDPEFRMTADSVALMTQGQYQDIRAGSIAAVAGKDIARVHYGAEIDQIQADLRERAFMTDKDMRSAMHPMATYKNYFKGQELNPFKAEKDAEGKPQWNPEKGYTVRDGGAALTRTIASSSPINQPLYRGDVVRLSSYRISGHHMSYDGRKIVEYEPKSSGQEKKQEIRDLKGKTIDILGATSFTVDPDVASSFSRGEGGGRKRRSEREQRSWEYQNVSVVYEVAPGARGVKAASLSPWRQQEVITSGRFQVTDVVEQNSYDGKVLGFTVKMEQVGNWDVD